MKPKNPWLSRKLAVTIATDVFALLAAFGGVLTAEQSGAIIALINTVYLVANAYASRA